MAEVFIGTSGWVYKEWGKKFFPKDLPQSEHLSFLAKHFNTVEINSTFYRLQPPENFVRWKSLTPGHFRFALKVSRYITHIKRMKAVRWAWKRFLRNALPLQEKQGPFLFQFPSSFHGGEEQIERIDHFLKASTGDGPLRMAFEFRHESCFSDAMLDVLKRYQAALVLANSSKYPTAPILSTTSFIYIRLHGPRQLFASSYSAKELKKWASLINEFKRQGKDVYVYFNNDFHAHAPQNAELLQAMINGNDER